MVKLTDTAARNLNPTDKAITAGGVTGLYLHPGSERGKGKWIFRFVSPTTGKRRDMGLGTYPEVGIAAARKAGLEARITIQQGTDPLALRQAQEAEIRARDEMPTFDKAARCVHTEIKTGFRNKKHADQWLNTLEAFIFPYIGARLVNDLKAADFAEALKPIWLSKPETASRVRQRCDTVMKWCAAQDYVVASPVGVVSKLLAKQPGKRERVEHHPAVPWRNIPEMANMLFRTASPTSGRAMLELLILTASRSGEIRGLEWSEINFRTATWTIPASRMKAKQAHRVPLSPRALEILREQQKVTGDRSLAFPTRAKTSSSDLDTPMSDMVLTKLLRDANVQSDAPGRTATAHGFRSAFRDWASENGYPRDLAERALAHTIVNSTEAAYHRTDLLEHRRKMMEDWANFFSGAKD